jgi:replication initiation protein RepC
MIEITSQNYEAAHERLGALRAAATVWAIMQFHDKIKAVGAYFRSITTGSKSEGFSPEKLIRRLATAQNYAV